MKCFDKVITFEDLEKREDVNLHRMLVFPYSKKQEVPVSQVVEVEYYLLKNAIQKDIDYTPDATPQKAPKDEVFIFPQEFGYVLIGSMTNDNKLVPVEPTYIGDVYDLLSDKQKLDYQGFIAAFQQAMIKAKELKEEKAKVYEGKNN